MEKRTKNEYFTKQTLTDSEKIFFLFMNGKRNQKNNNYSQKDVFLIDN